MKAIVSLAAAATLLEGTALASPGQYQLRPESPAQIRFTVDAPLDSIVGQSEAVTGSVQYDPETDSGSGQLSVSLASFRTGLSLRDEDLRDRFFEVDRFPRAELRIQRILPPDSSGRRVAIATLALHGVERPVRISIQTSHKTGDARPILVASGSFEVAFDDHQIRRPSVLFVKLGKVAKVEFRAALFGPGPATPETPALVAQSLRLAPTRLFRSNEFVPVARRALARGPRTRYPATTPAGRGERLLASANLGGSGNALTCVACHGVRDERDGLRAAGIVPPSRTLFGSAKRPVLWQGLAKTPGKAASLCVRLFMLNPAGLTAPQESDLEAFLAKISPDDAVPELDYRVLAMTRQASVANPTGGNRGLGAKLTREYCGDCHGAARMRPPLTAGLYEPDYLIRRVRWLEGHDAKQMPPIYVDRLTDTDLRHIVTFLAGTESQRVFDRTPPERASN